MLVLADDLTGAADAGVVFAAAGLDTVVRLGIGVDAGATASAGVVCVDTDSRHRDTAAARAAVREAVRATAGRRRVYKKIDSTLRGNVAAEIDSALEATGSDVAVMAPAFPATGRTTRYGHQLVAGLPLRRTGVWRGSEARAPDRVAELFDGSSLTVREIGLSQVRGGGEHLRAALRAAVSAGAQVAICDADTDEDLAAVAAAGAAQPDLRVLWVGSGGLAAHLPGALGIGPMGAGGSLGRVDAAMPGMSPGALLAVVGSPAAQSQAQADALIEAGFAAVPLPADLLGGASPRELADLAGQVSRTVQQGDTVVAVSGGGAVIDEHGAAARVAGRIGQVVAEALPTTAGLILTGGETARAVLRAVGVRSLRLVGETEPGVVISHAHTRPSVPVITKAGAFGDRDALLRAACVVAGHRLPESAQKGDR